MADVFISYSRVDAAFVRRLWRILVRQKREVWVDWRDIPPTAEWLAEIEAAIDAANDFAFVISPDSCASSTCRLELEHAGRNNKRLVPILYRDVAIEDVLPPLRKLNWIFFRESNDPRTASATLTQALDTDLEWVRAHTRLLVRCIEWAEGARDISLLLRGADLGRAVALLTEARATTKPTPTSLQREYVRVSQEAEASELERVRRLYARALASKLAAQARWLSASRLGALPLAMVLAIESMKRSPSPEAEQVLRACLALHPRRVARFDHDDSVGIIAFSPNGELLATASGAFSRRESYASEARGKDLEDFVDERDLNEFLKRGEELSGDPTESSAHLWDAFTGRELARLEHSGSVMSLAFGADGTRLATGSTDGAATVWTIPDARPICSVNLGVSPWQGTVALSPNGEWLITREADRQARVWDVATGREASRRGRDRATSAVSRAERERREQQAVRLDRSLRRHVRAELEEGAARLGVEVAADWRKADLLAAIAGYVFRRVGDSPPESEHASGFALSPDGRFVADAHRFTLDSNTVTVHDILGFERARLAPGGFVATFAFHPSSRHMCTAVEGRVELWELEPKLTLRFLECDRDVGALAFSQDGKYLVTAGEKRFAGIDPTAALWDVARGERVAMPADAELRRLVSSAVNQWVLESVDRHVVATREEPARVVEVHERGRRRLLARLEHEGWVRCAEWGSADLLATGTDLAAHVWNARHGRQLSTFEHANQVRSLAFDAAGERLATACDDSSARIWDLRSGHELVQVSHDDSVSAVAFSPDGIYLATGGEDNTARLWEIATGSEVARLLHNDSVRAVRFSPNGDLMATGSLDGSVALWVCCPGLLIDTACERITRNLSPAEWEHYLPEEPYLPTCPAAEKFGLVGSS